VGLLAAIGAVNAPIVPYINTDTHLDIATGVFVPGVNGEMILNGGHAPTNGYMGKPKQYKSTLMLSTFIRSMACYTDIEMVVYDTEDSLKQDRVAKLHGYHHNAAESEAIEKSILDRLVIMNKTQHDLESFHEMIKELAANKIKHIKDYTVETPILDIKTGKPLRMIIPTVVAYDSWSMASVKAIDSILDKHNASDSETNTIFMRTGRAKAIIMQQLSHLSATAGIKWGLSAHVGSKVDMGGSYGPPAKEMQFMKQGESTKHAGGSFLFLISNLIETKASRVLLDSNKEAEYPYATGITGDAEMNQITSVLTSCKNSPAGSIMMPVCSQMQGLDSGLTYYDYLRSNGYYGLVGNKVTHRPAFLPDTVMSRTQAISKLADKNTLRAIQLLYQLCWIQNNWSLRHLPIPFDITPEALCDALHKSTYAVSDILASRGYWTWEKNDTQYLSIFDVVAMATGNYKPKLLRVNP
jgi:hypothetical protein